MKITHRTLPFAVLLCALLWGSAFAGIKGIYASWDELGIEASYSHNFLIAGLRFSLAGLFLLSVAKVPLAVIKAAAWRPLIGFILFQTYFQYMFFYSALYVSSGTLGSILASTGSFWWLILAPFIIGSPWPTKYQWLLFFVGATGVTFAVYSPGTGSKNIPLGVLLFLTSSFCGALAILLFQKVNTGQGARALTGASLLVGGILLCLTAAPSWHLLPTLITPRVMTLTVYLAMVSAIAFALWNYLTQLFPVNLLAGYRFLIPLCAVIESSLLIPGETIGPGILIGGPLIITSIVFLQRAKQRQVHQITAK